MANDVKGNKILDQWHAAKAAHKVAPEGKQDAALRATFVAERAAIGHFGLGRQIDAYNARFPDDPI